MAKTQSIKIVWVIEILRQQDGTVWHRPAPLGGVFCGTLIGTPECRRFPVEDWPPADGELCQQCEQLYEADCQRRLGQVYRMLLGLAERTAGAGEAAEAVDAGTPAG